jgi:uncharacterized protein YhhL (DUF1145 family)
MHQTAITIHTIQLTTMHARTLNLHKYTQDSKQYILQSRCPLGSRLHDVTPHSRVERAFVLLFCQIKILTLGRAAKATRSLSTSGA